jgi:hypothetical protein
MSANLPSHFVETYATNMQLLLQQKDSRFLSYVMQGNHIGTGAAAVDQVGTIETQDVTSRYPDITQQDVPVDRRWVYPQAKYTSFLIDKFEELQVLLDPKASYTETAANAMRRKKDDVIIDAFFAAAATGTRGGTSTSFPSAQQVGVDVGGTASGLNVEKLLAGQEILRAGHVDPDEPVYCALAAKQIRNLMKEAQVVSSDFNNVKPLAEGKVVSFLGITFIPTQRLDVDGSSYRRLPMWVKSGMHFGVWQDVKTDISQIKTKVGHPWQVYHDMMIGATRLEEAKVVEIKCAE